MKFINGKKHCSVCHGGASLLTSSHRKHGDQPDCCCCDEHLRRYAGFDVTPRRAVV